MATTPGSISNFYVQQANAQVYLSWDLAAGATAYSVERSTDGVTYSVVSTPASPEYLDTTVTTGNTYFYRVAASNGTGVGPYTSPQSTVPTPAGEMSLGQIRLNAQQRADRLGSNFVTLPEWNSYINQSMYELYDLLIDTYEDYGIAPALVMTMDGVNNLYALPNGTNYNNAPAFYKLTGVDLAVNPQSNGWVAIPKFQFANRNQFVYPNTSSTMYGVFNLKYRLLGNQIDFIPTPSGNQQIRLWYIPRLTALLKDRDITSVSISGWIEYVIVDAAIKALQKEESDVSVLMAQKIALKQRIESAAQNRDAGMPETISDTRSSDPWGSQAGGYGGFGPIGGF